MKKLLLLSMLAIITALAACSSPEADELVHYHNDFVETVNPKAEQIDMELQELAMIEAPDEALQFQNENITPIVNEIMEYINSMEPETEVVKELHELRLSQLSSWSEGFEFRHKAMERAAESAEEQEINQLIQQSDEKFMETMENAQKADAKLVEMAEEFNVEIDDTEGTN